jgi:hypothetical protein
MLEGANDVTNLEVRWKGVLDSGSGLFNLVDAAHPLRLYMGGNSNREPTLTVILTKRPPTIPKFSSLIIEQRIRQDGTWLLLLQLQSMPAFHEFVTMCAELIARSQECADEEAGLASFLICLDHWRNLFRPIRDDLLSEQEIRGLAAELLCMLRIMGPSRPWAEIIHGWVGPLKAPQDFNLSGLVYVEAKSIHKGSKSIKISSLEQLDLVDARLLLSTHALERAVKENSTDCVSLRDLCCEVESFLAGSFELVDEFHSKLKNAGFDVLEPYYEEYCFRESPPSIYEVGPDFPRIVRSDVRGGVLQAQYDLEVDSLAPFEIQLEGVFARVAEGK